MLCREFEVEEDREDSFDGGAIVCDVGVGDADGCAFMNEFVA